ncbi:hypothetical protein AOY87_13975 [Escherichia coli]|nr:hypothetical protein AOY87_13975 [Escherichia coli]
MITVDVVRPALSSIVQSATGLPIPSFITPEIFTDMCFPHQKPGVVTSPRQKPQSLPRSSEGPPPVSSGAAVRGF